MFWVANAGTSAAGPTDDFWFEGVPARGVRGGGGSAWRQVVVYACTRVLGETVGHLPLALYRRLKAGGKERVTNHPTARMVSLQPNPLQTGFEWREQQQARVALRGNTYSRIEFDGAGRPIRLWPMHPDKVQVEWIPQLRRLVFVHTREDGSTERLGQDEVLHIPGLMMEGYLGLNPIEAHRQTLALAAAARQFGERVYTSDGALGGWIEHPNNFKDKEARNQYRNAWREQVRSGGVPILEYGLKYHEVGMKMTDAQFIETRKYSAIEICQMFRMPPHKVQILDQAKWANIEQQSIDFVTDTMLPWLKRWEQRLNSTLLLESEQEDLFFEFNVDALLRGDSAARAAFYEKMLKNRVIVPNEARERENLNPVDWGNEPLPMPNQSVPAGEPEDADRERSSALERGAAQAVVQKELHEVRAIAQKVTVGEFAAAVEAFYRDDLAPFAARVLAVSPAKAQAYARASCDAVLAAAPEAGLPPLLTYWKAHRADQLLEIIHAS
jgi:HK97 family phage portal protein